MNHLPFVRRAAITVPANPARRAVTLPAMSMGRGRQLLQDVEVWQFGAVNFYKPNDTVPNGQNARASRLLLRYGWEKQGFLTEAFHPAGSFVNKGRPLVPVWKFERPYRIDPGQSLSAVITAGGGYSLATMPAESTPAVMFNAVRAKDGQPKLLYDVSRTVDATQSTQGLSFHCDADSSMYLYSVSIHDWYEYNAVVSLAAPPQVSELQIFGPGGREWMHYESVPTLTAAQLNQIKGGWLEGFCDKIDLGEQGGWVQEFDESFVIELMQQSTSASDVVALVTLRGVLEKPND